MDSTLRDSQRDSLERAAALIATSAPILVFTGAGISVESGIPPFRGEGGIWGRYDPSLLEIGEFRAKPMASWAVIREIFYESFGLAKPNPAHEILADWEARGLVDFTVTQNIDGLHRAAGAKRLSEFHGAMGELVCTACKVHYEATRELLAPIVPTCPACGGLLKPDFVFFGEGIPHAARVSAFDAAARASLCLIVGSTGQVYPAASVPLSVRDHGGILIEVDPGHTEFSDLAEVHLRMGASAALREIDAILQVST